MYKFFETASLQIAGTKEGERAFGCLSKGSG
jgi:hypothetical protein